MKKIKSLSILIMLLVCTSSSIYAADPVWKFDIECSGTASDGSYLVKVWSYGKNAKISSNEVKQNAVYGILFRGFAAGEQGCKAQKPIIKAQTAYEDNKKFFESFFGKKGDVANYANYATIISPAPEVIKVQKEYKVGYIVSVSKDALRKAMEDAGVIKGLASGF